jgi:phage/plasmid-like protein (TIGR03299 family)
MAHLVETMAYANEVPWHGLGKPVHPNMTPLEMMDAAGLNWTVSKRPAYFPDKANCWNLNDPRSEAGLVHATENFFLVRDSDNKMLSPCGTGYQPFQNEEVMGFFKKFTEAGHMQMETAGSLKGGREVWGLAKIKEGFTLAGGDPVTGYLLLNNSHVVGKAMTVMFTPIRVVCNNTLTMALDNNGHRFRVMHLQMFSEEIMQAAEEALGISHNYMARFQEQAEFLASKRYDILQVDNFIAELYQPKTLLERGKAGTVAANDLPPLRDEFKRTALAVADALETSPGAELRTAKGTWWGALNAVTYVTDHQTRGTEEGNSLHSAWFGGGATVKRRALEKALEYAQAA